MLFYSAYRFDRACKQLLKTLLTATIKFQLHHKWYSLKPSTKNKDIFFEVCDSYWFLNKIPLGLLRFSDFILQSVSLLWFDLESNDFYCCEQCLDRLSRDKDHFSYIKSRYLTYSTYLTTPPPHTPNFASFS